MRGLVSLIMVLMVSAGTILFNGWFLEQVYILGIWPFLDLVGHELPQLEYRYFVLIGVVISCVYYYFKGAADNDVSRGEKRKINFNDSLTSETWLNNISLILTSIVNKLYLLLILFIVNLVCF